VTDKLKTVLRAIDEVLDMDELQLIAAKKQFNWCYLRQAKDILVEIIGGIQQNYSNNNKPKHDERNL
jgi:hypothetical protein